MSRTPSDRLRRLMPSQLGAAAANRRAILQFAEQTGLVHFGFVDQNNDEHRLVRGVTVSTHHTDSHYCIGSFEGYDVTFVERTDKIDNPKKRSIKTQNWHILQIDLTTKLDLPMIFLGLHTHSEAFYQQMFIRHRTLVELRLGVLAPQPKEFLSRYRVYARAAHAIDVERFLPPAVTTNIAKHFGSVAVEIHGQTLYLYSEHAHISAKLLLTMLENGIWLARQIDSVENT